jgi:hypothetical protein
MIEAAGFNGEGTAGELLKVYHANSEMTTDQRMAITSFMCAANQIQLNRFSPKLTFTQQCEILALYHKGHKRNTLAKIYGVNRRTVTHMYNPKSKHYKKIREEELRLGVDNFRKLYLTDQVLRTAQSFVEENNQENNNQYANKKQGIHTMRNDMCDYDHRVVIQWKERDEGNIKVSGWYYKDLDSEWPDDWFHGDEESLKSSNACYTYALTDISDKL